MNYRKFSTNVFKVNSSEQIKFLKTRVDKVIKILKKKESLKNKPKRPLTPFQRYINTQKILFQNDPNMYQRIK